MELMIDEVVNFRMSDGYELDVRPLLVHLLMEVLQMGRKVGSFDQVARILFEGLLQVLQDQYLLEL